MSIPGTSYKSSSNKVFHFEKSTDGFSQISKHRLIELYDNNTTFKNVFLSKYVIVPMDLEAQFEKFNNQLLGFKVAYGE